MKYIVTINATTKTFDNYADAMTFFKKNWLIGDTYKIVKVDAHGVVFSY